MKTNTKPKRGLESAVDTGGNIVFSLTVGSTIDAFGGMPILGIVADRATATGINLTTAALYGKWRNFLFRKTLKIHDNRYFKEALRKGMFYGASALAGLTATPSYGYSGIADYLVDTGKAQNYLVDLLAFNTFQVPVYVASLSVGSLVSQHRLNTDQVAYGAKTLMKISPLIGPSLGAFLDFSRKLFQLKSAPDKARASQGGQDGSHN